MVTMFLSHLSGTIEISGKRYALLMSSLKLYGLVFDELYLCNDKIKLLPVPPHLPDLCVCVDDSPQVLLEAKSRGIVATGLRFPWNREVDVELCLNLREVFDLVNGICNNL